MTTDNGMGTQDQPQEADSPGPSNRASRDEEAALRPGRKVSAATVAMFLTTIIAYTLNQFYAIELPPEVSAAITGLLGILVAYFVPEGS